jgi:hypothetical protein
MRGHKFKFNTKLNIEVRHFEIAKFNDKDRSKKRDVLQFMWRGL